MNAAAKAWLERYGNSGAFVWNKEQFDQVNPAKLTRVPPIDLLRKLD